MALDDWRWSVVCNRGPQPDRGKGIPTSEKEQGLLNHADEDTKGNSAEATFLVHYSRKKRRFRCAIWQRHLLKKKIRTISTIGSVSIVVPGSVQVTQNRLVRLVGLEYQLCSQCWRQEAQQYSMIYQDHFLNMGGVTWFIIFQIYSVSTPGRPFILLCTDLVNNTVCSKQ